MENNAQLILGVQERPALMGNPTSLESSSLCPNCQNIFAQFEEVDQWPQTSNRDPDDIVEEDKNILLSHWENDELLHTSAENGCILCEQFILGFRDVESQDELQACNSNEGVRIWAPVTARIPPSDYWALELYLKTVRSATGERSKSEDNGTNYAHYLVDVVRADQGTAFKTHNINDLSGLQLCSTWLKECQDSHAACNGPKNHSLPSRLIAVDGPQPKLCITSQLDSSVQYATLSHCWGAARFVTLTHEVSRRFEEGIPSEALPKTFLDAIHITRYLGIKFLWIDSLCILQDDGQDWERESALMTNVYGNSTVNISAISAKDGNGGCLFPRSRLVKRRIHWNSGAGDSIYDCFPSALMNPDWESPPPLETRGWCLQEYFLPPRTIHFFKDQTFWACHESAACEIFGSGLPESYPISFCKIKKPISRALWPSIAERYSSRNLTHAKDKLVAISGLANLVHAQTGGQYVAGMWRENLDLQLNWSVIGSLADRIQPYISPTWSWATVSSQISFLSIDRSTTNACFKIKSVDLSHQSHNVFGELRSASLRLCCDYLLQGPLYTSQGYRTEYVAFWSGRYVEMFIHWDIDMCRRINASEAVSELDEHDQVQSDRRNRALGLKLVFLPGWIEQDGNFSGIVLEPTREQRGQYRRLGRFSPAASAKFQIHEVAGLQDNRVQDSHCVDICHNDDGRITYIIDMV